MLQALEIPYQVIETSTGDMGDGQVSDERHRILGAEPWQISRDAQLLDPARLAGAAREPSLARRGAQGALRPHAEQHRFGDARGILVPLLENHQTADGRVRLPAPLAELMGGEYL